MAFKNLFFIQRAAREMGAVIEPCISERGCFFIFFPKKNKRIFVEKNFSIAEKLDTSKNITRFKDLTCFFLKKNGLPTPNACLFVSKDIEKKSFFSPLKKMSFPLVIKDAEGSNSRGVFTYIKNIKEAERVLRREAKKFSCLIAQEMVFGKEYRVLLLEDRVIGALQMIPPYVLGDGKNTIQSLIKKKQSRTLQKTPFDKTLKEILARQNCHLSTVLKKKEKIFIKENASLAEGGEMYDVTDKIHAHLPHLATKAAQAVERKLVGIDIICEDIAKDPRQQSFSILEINGKPDLYIHYRPNKGKKRDVARDILEFASTHEKIGN